MKSLLLASFLILLFAFSINADIAKPKPPDKVAKQVLHTGLEIVPDSKLYEAKLQISQSDFNNLRAALDGGAGSAPVVGGIAFSAPRTIIAGLLMFMAISVAGVFLARSSSFGRAQKTIGAVVLVAIVLGAAAIITRGNAGPPGSYRWRNLPQALAEVKATAGGLDIEIIPDDAKASGANMRLMIPLKKSNPGEE